MNLKTLFANIRAYVVTNQQYEGKDSAEITSRGTDPQSFVEPRTHHRLARMRIDVFVSKR